MSEDFRIPKIPTKDEILLEEGRNNAIVAACFDLCRHGGYSWEEALLLAVRELSEQNTRLASRLLKALQEAAPAPIPVSDDMQQYLAELIAVSPELAR